MKVVIATPLYPPDIAEPAPYVKELARRLSKEHEVTVVAYGHLPEPVEGVRILAVEKRRALPVRLIAYFFTLLNATQGAHVLYAENGSSTELAATLVSYLTRVPLVLHLGDRAAHTWAKEHPLRRGIEHFATWRAARVVKDMPREKPEIIPFKGRDTSAESAYATSWDQHLALVAASFTHD